MKRAVVAAALLLSACGAASDRVVVGAGTTLVDSGFIESVIEGYELANPGVEISVLGESSLRLLDLGRRGEADLLITHEPRALSEFVDEGLSADTDIVFTSRFLVVGPPDRSTALDGLTTAAALARIAAEEWPFFSRGDGSGTHAKELIVWDIAAIDPSGEEWYEETGQGMGLTLQVADQRNGLTITEEGAWLQSAASLGLRVANLSEFGELENPYFATVVAGDGLGSAKALYDWLLSAEGATSVFEVNMELFGHQVYLHPQASRTIGE